MAIPEFQTFMKPFLASLGDGRERSMREMIEEMAKVMKASDEDRKEMLESGQARFDNRVGWARAYLSKAGLIESPSRGFVKITKRGLDVLKENPRRIDKKFLNRYPEFVEFQKTRRKKKKNQENDNNEHTITPEELLDKAYSEIRAALAGEILNNVYKLNPNQFEKLVVQLLVKMGYGGSMQDAGQAIGKTGDEGIDGVIKEDKLGLDKIYIQAKKWDPQRAVSGSDVQAFVGALEGKGARKGVFITTARFSSAAQHYKPTNSTMVKIDGSTLAQYMIDHGLGVTTISTYEIKRIDSDYFDTV